MSFEIALREKIKGSTNSLEKNLLKVVLGEMQQNNIVLKEQCYSIVKNIIGSNNVNLSYLKQEDERYSKYLEENKILGSLLPKYLSKEESFEKLKHLIEQIKDAKNENQSMGIAMKFLKQSNLDVESTLIKEIVQEVRSS